MSTNTPVFGLFAYDPETDGNLPFNINQALNNNWDKIDSLVLPSSAAAAPYDPSGTYNVGDYCIYNGTLQKCNTPIPSGETWNPEHWTETTVANQLVRSLLQLDYSLEDVSNPPKKPFFMVSKITGATGLPSWWPAGRNTFIRFCAVDSQYAFDVAANYTNKRVAFRLSNDGSWFEFATVTPPESVAIPLNSGFTGTLRAERNQFGEVLLTGEVAAESINANDLIATLPDGFLPKASNERFTMVSNRGAGGNSFATLGQISSDGNVNLWRVIPNNYAANTYLVINHNYQART